MMISVYVTVLCAQTFISQMNSRIQAQMAVRNPWEFRHVRNLEVSSSIFASNTAFPAL